MRSELMVKILIIEDETNIRENLEAILQLEDFETLAADNGRLGVELALQEQPDLILCDVMMPQLDGYGVLKALKDEPKTALIPLIFLTARSERNDLRRGMELGADDYLTKPFTLDELLMAVRTRLEKQKRFKTELAQEMSQLRSNITRSLPHEFLTPLNGILGVTDLLIHYGDSLTAEEVLSYLKDIEQSGQRLHHLVLNLLLFAELELLDADPQRQQVWRGRSSQQTALPHALEKVFSKVLTQYSRLEDGVVSGLKGEEALMVALAEEDFNKIVAELLDNACKFSAPATPIGLALSFDPDFVTIVLTDRGRGMTSQHLSQIGAYMQFERKLYEQQGSGLGLILARRLTELYGGSLAITSQISQGTTITIILPRSKSSVFIE
jgi:two-component system sensor kinase